MEQQNKNGFSFSFPISKELQKNLQSFDTKPLTMRELVDSVKQDEFTPPLNQIKVENVTTGEKGTLADYDQMLNN